MRRSSMGFVGRIVLDRRRGARGSAGDARRRGARFVGRNMRAHGARIGGRGRRTRWACYRRRNGDGIAFSGAISDGGERAGWGGLDAPIAGDSLAKPPARRKRIHKRGKHGMSRKVAIIDGVRTPLCKAGGVLATFGADDLGAVVVRELVVRTGIDPARVDEVIFGAVAHPAEAMNLARVIAGKAGLPKEVIAQTVQRNCASGMQSLTPRPSRSRRAERPDHRGRGRIDEQHPAHVRAGNDGPLHRTHAGENARQRVQRCRVSVRAF